LKLEDNGSDVNDGSDRRLEVMQVTKYILIERREALVSKNVYMTSLLKEESVSS
jgi:hypothetical protein